MPMLPFNDKPLLRARTAARTTAVIPVAALSVVVAVLLSGCEIVDTGPTRIGGVSCGWSDAAPGTPEYHRCRSRNADEGRVNQRTPSGGIGF